MARLARTTGLTDVQRDILATVHEFVDKEIIPHAQHLEHADEYPQEIVDGMREMGLFGLTIAEEYGGLGESLLTQHGTAEQRERLLPKMAAGEIRGAFSMSEPGTGSDTAAIRTKAVPAG